MLKLLPCKKLRCFPLRERLRVHISNIQRPSSLHLSAASLSTSIHHTSYLLFGREAAFGSSRYSCPSSLDEIYCVLLPSLPPHTERKGLTRSDCLSLPLSASLSLSGLKYGSIISEMSCALLYSISALSGVLNYIIIFSFWIHPLIIFPMNALIVWFV